MEELAKSPEELEARMAAEQGQKATEVGQEQAAPPAEDSQGAPSTENQGEQVTESSSTDWLKQFNESLGTEFKDLDEIRPLLDLPSKVKDYEEKEESYKSFLEQEKSYKSKISELESSLNPLEYFSTPEAYIAEQLRKQHPDKSPTVLHEVVTGDLKEMGDIDVLVKSIMLEHPDLAEKGAREYIEGELGIDPEVPWEEQESSVKTKVKIKAGEKRKELAALKQQVNIPVVLTPEQREQQKAEQMEKVKADIKPLAEKFAQFDKFSTKVGDEQFEFVVPDEYKNELKPMFENFFLAGNEVNEQNLQTITELRDALLLSRHLPSVYRAIESDVEARIRKEVDEKLGNTAPPNAATAADDGGDLDNPHGMGAFLKSL